MHRYVVPEYDPNTDVVEFIEEVPETTNHSEPFWSRPLFGSLLRWLPVGRSTEAVIAECLGQSLTAGLNEVDSLLLAARIFRQGRMGRYLREAAEAVENGQPLHAAFKQTHPRLSASFHEAIRVGGNSGQLAIELRVVARRLSPQVFQQLTRWTGRSKHAIHFASALSRLMDGRRLTATAVDDAGKIAAAGNKSFQMVVTEVVDRMKDGDSLSQTLHRFPRNFDPMFIRFVEVASSRAALHNNLNLLAGNLSIGTFQAPCREC